MPVNPELSEREQEILRLLATGASNKEIAQQLQISANTVKVHLRNIFGKISVASRTEAALYAVRTGLAHEIAPAALVEPGPVSAAEVGGNGSTGAPAGEATAPAALPERAPVSRRQYWLLGLGILVLAGLALGAAALRYLRSRQPPTEAPSWRTLAALPTPRSGLALAAYEGSIYAVGGEQEGTVLGRVERFDPGGNRWTSAADKPTPAADILAGVIGGRIYVPGGRLESGGPFDGLEIYDPRIDAWTRGPNLPVGVSGYALAVYEGRLYLFGGWDGAQVLDTVLEFDPASGAWSQKTPMPTARAWAGAAQAVGKIFVLGGSDGRQALRASEAYVPDLDDGGGSPWAKGNSLPSARYAMGVVGIADIIHIVGGIQNEDRNSSFEYLAQSDQWQEYGSFAAQAWTHPGMVALGPNVYVIGGELNGVATGQNISYQAIYTLAIPMVR